MRTAPPAPLQLRPEAGGSTLVEPAWSLFPTPRAEVDDWRARLEDVLLLIMLVTCFGAVVGMYMKVNVLKEAPGWAVGFYLIPLTWAAIAALREPHKALRSALLGGPLLLFVLYAAMSFMWSNQPQTSLTQGILYCATYLVAVMLTVRLPWWRLGRVIGGVFAVQGTLSAMLAIGKPEWGVMTEIYPGAWAGIWTFKQQLGIAMATGLAFVVGHGLAMPRSRVWTVPAALIMLVCVVRSEATTAALVSFVVVASAALVWFAQRHPAATILSVWSVIAGAAFGLAFFTFLSDLFFDAVNKAPTLTGRTDIWAALQPALDARPVLGWGYQAFWTDRSMTSPVDLVEAAMDGFRPPDAHSTPIDIRLQLGWIGFALAVAWAGRAWLQSLTLAPREPAMMLAIPYLVAVTSICFTEALGLYPMDFQALSLMVVVIKVAQTAWDRADAAAGRPALT